MGVLGSWTRAKQKDNIYFCLTRNCSQAIGRKPGGGRGREAGGGEDVTSVSALQRVKETKNSVSLSLCLPLSLPLTGLYMEVGGGEIQTKTQVILGKKSRCLGEVYGVNVQLWVYAFMRSQPLHHRAKRKHRLQGGTDWRDCKNRLRKNVRKIFSKDGKLH